MLVVVSEHPVTRLKGSDSWTDGDHFSGELIAQDLVFRSKKTAEETGDDILCASKSAVRAVHRGGVHTDQDVMVARNRLVHFYDLDDLRRAISGMSGSFHSNVVRVISTA